MDQNDAVGATVGIQAVGSMGISLPLMKVFLDGRVVGLLKDMTVHDFPIVLSQPRTRR